jgi:hypothetical protein
LGPGLNSSEYLICRVFPITNMSASYNGSKVDFKWAHVHGSTFKPGIIVHYDISICAVDFYSCNILGYFYSLNASVEMGYILEKMNSKINNPKSSAGTILYADPRLFSRSCGDSYLGSRA